MDFEIELPERRARTTSNMEDFQQDLEPVQYLEPEYEEEDFLEPMGRRGRTCSDMTDVSCSTAASESDLPEEVKRPCRKLDRFVSNHGVSEAEWTTLMIKNIPNRYGLEWLLSEIQETGLECNFLHLPLIKRSHANVGYAFVNFQSPQDALEFKEVFEEHRFIRQPGSKKRANVIFAKLQGFNENVKFFSNRKGNSERAPWILETC
jgi:hypothetical protein